MVYFLKQLLNDSDDRIPFKIFLQGSFCQIGRKTHSCLSPFTNISRLHAVLIKAESSDNLVVLDSKSSNGTFVNGVNIKQNFQTLKVGDIISFGGVETPNSCSCILCFENIKKEGIDSTYNETEQADNAFDVNTSFRKIESLENITTSINSQRTKASNEVNRNKLSGSTYSQRTNTADGVNNVEIYKSAYCSVMEPCTSYSHSNSSSIIDISEEDFKIIKSSKKIGKISSVKKLNLKSCYVPLVKCDSKYFHWPSDAQNPFNKRKMVEQLEDKDFAVSRKKHIKIPSSDDEKEISYSQVEEVIIISDDESYLDFNSSQNYVNIKEEAPDELEDNYNDLCKQIFEPEPGSSNITKKVIQCQDDNSESIENIAAFVKASENQIEKEKFEEINDKSIIYDLELECNEESDSNSDEMVNSCTVNHITENSLNNKTVETKDKMTDSFNSPSNERIQLKKSAGRILLTEPKPMPQRPYKIRGREEGFIERHNYEDPPNFKHKKQIIKTKSNVKSSPIKTLKNEMCRKFSASKVISNKSSNLKSFKIPKIIISQNHINTSDDKKNSDSTKDAPNLSNSSSNNNNNVIKKRSPSVKTRSEKFASRSQFLDTDLSKTQTNHLRNLKEYKNDKTVKKNNSRFSPEGILKETPKYKKTNKQIVDNISEKGKKIHEQTYLPKGPKQVRFSIDQWHTSRFTPINTLHGKSEHNDKFKEDEINFPSSSNRTSLLTNSTSFQQSEMFPTVTKKVNKSNSHNNSMNDLSFKNAISEGKNFIYSPTNEYNNFEVDYLHMIKKILKFKPIWLQEQIQHKYPPPQVSEGASALSLYFTSYDHYVASFYPMIILEIWDYIFTESKEIFKSNRIHKKFYFSLLSYASKIDCIELKCESIVNEKISFNPHEGYLVMMDIKVDSKQRLSLFGYIHRHNTCALNINYVKNSPWKSLPKEWIVDAKHWTFDVYIKKKDMTFVLGSIMKGNGICFLRSKLRLVDALKYVKASPLLENIIQPNFSAFNVTYPMLFSTREYTASQMKAIEGVYTEIKRLAIKPKIILVQGPPGTGKTHTIIGLLKKLMCHDRSKQILVVAPSNAAIDEIGYRLVKLNEQYGLDINFVRIGSAANINKKMTPYFLDYKAKEKHNQIILSDLKLKEKEIENLRKEIAQLEKNSISNNSTEKLRCLKDRHKYLENMNREKKLDYKTEMSYKETILKECSIVLSTLNSCASSLMLRHFKLNSKMHFSCCIMDESTQCTEIEVLQPLIFGINKLILFGDHEQLPATVTSNLAQQYGYEKSMFERFNLFFERYHHQSPVFTLEEQFRMHSKICEFPSKHFYHERLHTDPQTDIKYKQFPLIPYVVLDVVNSQESNELSSKLNCVEASVIVNICRCLIDVLESSSSIGIITFYSGQRLLYATALHQNPRYRDIEINTVDGFQGREKDVIILSCVRANSPSGGIGFVANRNRLNVAITRAKKCLIICCHIDSIRYYNDWRLLLDDSRQRNVCFHVPSSQDIPVIFEQFIKKIE